jgi:hypothetical protein
MATVALATIAANGAGRAANASSAPPDAEGDTPDFETVMAGQSAHSDDPAPRSDRTAAPRPIPASDQAPPPAAALARPTPSDSAAAPAEVPPAPAVQANAATPGDQSLPPPNIASDPAGPAETKDEPPAEPEEPALTAPPVVATPAPIPTPIPPAAMQAFGVAREPAATTEDAMVPAPEAGSIEAPAAARVATEEQAPLPIPEAPPPGTDATRIDLAPTQFSAKMATDGTAQAGPAAPAPPPVVETQRQLAVHIGKAAQAGESTLTINLNPIDLGPVAVRLFFHAGGVDLQLTVANRTTYDSLVLDQSGLEQQLAQAGVNLTGGGVDLRFGAPDGGEPQGRTAPGFTGRTDSGAQRPSAEIVEHTLLPGQGLLNIIA